MPSRGFDDERDQALLDGWLRSCVVDMGAVGRAKTGEQMLAIAPLTLAAYRAGLPKERTRHRGIDDVVYRLLLDAGAPATCPTPGPARRRGAARAGHPHHRPRARRSDPGRRGSRSLDDPAQLDIGALLAFRFVEGFAMGDAREVDATAPDSPLPGVTAEPRRDAARPPAGLRRAAAGAALMSSFAALMATGHLHVQPSRRRRGPRAAAHRRGARRT